MIAAERTAKRHMGVIKSKMISRSTVIGIRKMINASKRKALGYSVGVTASAVDPHTLAAIMDTIKQYHPTVLGELHDSGLKLLSSKRHRKALAPVARIIAPGITRFDLIEMEMLDRVHCVPVYRAISRIGYFDFRNIPWQSGGKGPEILSSMFGKLECEL